MTEEKKLFLRTEEDGGSYERENVDFKLRRRFAEQVEDLGQRRYV